VAVTAAGLVFLIGRLTYTTVSGYEDFGAGPLLVIGGVAVLAGLAVFLRDRSRLQRWAAQESPRPDPKQDRADDEF
jgi:hypothetical protein